MSWFSRQKAPKPSDSSEDKLQIPDDIWSKCPACSAVLYTRELRRNSGVCLECNYHFQLKARDRLPLLIDRHSFDELDGKMRSADPLGFRDSRRYRERVRRAERDSGSSEAVMTGRAAVMGIPVVIGVFEYDFIGGSMGSVVGEKLARMLEAGLAERRPAIILSASGGARMQEGIFSLMQMAKVSAVLAKLAKESIPYLSILTHPTTGGVAASFAMLGDVIFAEPKALIGFAGPRVIEQTIRQTLPDGFQRAEFLLEHGMVDRIVQRTEMKGEVAKVLSHLGFGV